MDIKIFKNKNINIKIRNIEDVNKDYFSEYVYNCLLDNDFSIPYNSGCAGNYTMYDTLYNYYTDGIYMILHSQIKELMKGKTIKLYYTAPSAEDIEAINNI